MSGNEYVLKDICNEATPAENGQKLSWEDVLGDEKELLSNGQNSLGSAPMIDDSFSLFAMGAAGMAGVTAAVAANKSSNSTSEPNLNAAVANW